MQINELPPRVQNAHKQRLTLLSLTPHPVESSRVRPPPQPKNTNKKSSTPSDSITDVDDSPQTLTTPSPSKPNLSRSNSGATGSSNGKQQRHHHHKKGGEKDAELRHWQRLADCRKILASVSKFDDVDVTNTTVLSSKQDSTVLSCAIQDIPVALKIIHPSSTSSSSCSRRHLIAPNFFPLTDSSLSR